jgi:hypothetical protein
LGTGLLKKKPKKNVLGFAEYARYGLKENIISLICIHGPTEGLYTDIKEQFYEELQTVNDRNSKHVTLILGDMSTKVGTEATYEPVRGKKQTIMVN